MICSHCRPYLSKPLLFFWNFIHPYVILYALLLIEWWIPLDCIVGALRTSCIHMLWFWACERSSSITWWCMKWPSTVTIALVWIKFHQESGLGGSIPGALVGFKCYQFLMIEMVAVESWQIWGFYISLFKCIILLIFFYMEPPALDLMVKVICWGPDQWLYCLLLVGSFFETTQRIILQLASDSRPVLLDTNMTSYISIWTNMAKRECFNDLI